MKYYFKALRNYFNFKGRASRKEFWLYMLFDSIFLILAIVLDYVCKTYISLFGPQKIIGWIFVIYYYATYVPSISVGVRRLHDSGRIGWMYFVRFAPFIGFIWYLYLMTIKGTQGTNQYGEVPE